MPCQLPRLSIICAKMGKIVSGRKQASMSGYSTHSSR